MTWTHGLRVLPHGDGDFRTASARARVKRAVKVRLGVEGPPRNPYRVHVRLRTPRFSGYKLNFRKRG